MERLYCKLLEAGSLAHDMKKAVLWTAREHPSAVFRAKAGALRTYNMTELLRGPPWTYNPLWTTREAMQQDIRWGVVWKGKRYRVGRLTMYQDFLTLITDFLF